MCANAVPITSVVSARRGWSAVGRRMWVVAQSRHRTSCRIGDTETRCARTVAISSPSRGAVPHGIIQGSPSRSSAVCVRRDRVVRRRSVIGGQRRALGPRAVEILFAHRVTQRRKRGCEAGLVDLEADLAGALPDGGCGAEEPGRFGVTAGIAGKTGYALQDVGNTLVRLDAGCTLQRRGRRVRPVRAPPARSRRERASSGPSSGASPSSWRRLRPLSLGP